MKNQGKICHKDQRCLEHAFGNLGKLSALEGIPVNKYRRQCYSGAVSDAVMSGCPPHMRLRGWNPILGRLREPSGAVSQAVRAEAEAAGSQESGRVWVPGISANQLC